MTGLRMDVFSVQRKEGEEKGQTKGSQRGRGQLFTVILGTGPTMSRQSPEAYMNMLSYQCLPPPLRPSFALISSTF